MDGLAPAFLRGITPENALHSGILYIEDFDAYPSPPPPPPPPAVMHPTFTQEDIEAARLLGYKDGMEAAASDRDAVRAQLATAALSAIGDALAAAHGQAVAASQVMAGELAATIVGLLAAALPAAAEASAGREITALMDMLLPPLVREPSLEVRVHPAVLEEVSESLRQGWPELAPRLQMIADVTLDTADVALTWQHGEARRDMQTLWRDLRAILETYHLPSLDAIVKGMASGQ